jgi:hypothetical protein
MCELLAGKTAAPLYADEGNLLATKPKPCGNSTPAAAFSSRISDQCGVSTSAAGGRAGLGRAHSRNKAFLGLTQ